MLFPLTDDDRALIKPAIVTWTLLILNVLVFLVQLNSPTFTFGYATVPAEITTGRDIVEPVEVQVAPGKVAQIPHSPGPSPIQLTLLSAMFMHGGLLHLASNMLYLWIFGDNVEHRFGHLPFLIFYLASGLVASFAHIAMNSGSIVPSLGASGAISGVLGAYLILFPRNRVYALLLVWIVTVPAFLIIALWAVSQFISGYGSLSDAPNSSGVAYAAHIGGFLAGVALALVFRKRLGDEPESVFKSRYRKDSLARRWW